MKKNTLFALCAFSTLAYFAGAQQISSSSQASHSSNSSVTVDRSGANIQSDNRADASGQATVVPPERHGVKEAEQPKKPSGRSKHSSNDSASASQGLASGTTVNAVLTKPLDSRKCKPGDPVQATAAQDVKSGGNVVIRKGSHLVGHVTEVKSKGKGDANSSLGIVFDHAVLKDGQQVPMNSVVQALAAAQSSSVTSLGDDNFGAASGGSLASSGGVVSRGSATGGGLVGGVASTAGAATGTVGNVGWECNGGRRIERWYDSQRGRPSGRAEFDQHRSDRFERSLDRGCRDERNRRQHHYLAGEIRAPRQRHSDGASSCGPITKRLARVLESPADSGGA